MIFGQDRSRYNLITYDLKLPLGLATCFFCFFKWINLTEQVRSKLIFLLAIQRFKRSQILRIIQIRLEGCQCMLFRRYRLSSDGAEAGYCTQRHCGKSYRDSLDIFFQTSS
ncbi:hypothetical protein C1H84_16940 [Glutamicibacter soli]|uniref:Uncharacterized protein n=1 Tax=Glutamicibacter soli TaxID=453836 RepID=A0A365YAA7_9MICC|nr:hypothetical protein C1H84_16940 [Glutamicibacter soli]